MGNFTPPSGFRFLPTDNQLVGNYLKNKILKNTLPCDIIKEVNVYGQHPKDLCDLYMREGEPAMYFFSPRERKYPRGSRPKRQAGQGRWKASGVTSPIKINNATKAISRRLVYCTSDNKKTDWIMYEYVMEQHSIPAISKPDVNGNSQIASSSNAVYADNNTKLDEWVLCKVYKKAWKLENENEPTSCNAVNFQHRVSQIFSTSLSPETQSGLHVGSSSSPGVRFHSTDRKLGFPAVKNMAFPPGFRFHPTDEELVIHYLMNKIDNTPLPCDVIEEFNINKYCPEELYDKRKEKGDEFLYFFTPRERRYPHGNRPKREANNGRWCTTNSCPVTVQNIEVARKTSLVYHNGNTKNSTRTDWLMYEYVMNQNSTPAVSKPANGKRSRAAASTSNARPEDNNMKLDDWVLCKIYKSNRKNQAAISDGASPIISAPAEQGANVRENADAIGSMDSVGSTFFDSTSSAMAVQTMDERNVGFLNPVPFLEEYINDNAFLNLENFTIQPDWLD